MMLVMMKHVLVLNVSTFLVVVLMFDEFLFTFGHVRGCVYQRNQTILEPSCYPITVWVND